MNSTLFWLFLASSWLLIITPGPDMLYVITRGLAQGRRAGLVSALGVACGILAHTLLAAFGLAIVLRTSVLAFAVVKYAGSGYLIFLGIRTLLSATPLKQADRLPCHSFKTLFTQGFLTNLLNPKIALFFLAFLPQFVSPGSMNSALQMFLLGVCYAVCSTIFLSAISLFSASIGLFFNRTSLLSQLLSKMTGCVFIALGVKLLFARQPVAS